MTEEDIVLTGLTYWWNRLNLSFI